MIEEFKGHNGLLIVDSFKITIKFNYNSTNAHSQKEIYLKNITSIEIKKPTILKSGYIEFLYPGSDSQDDEKNDSRIIIYYDKEYLEMVRAKQLIEHHLSEAHLASRSPAVPPSPASSSTAASAPVSIVDELKKAAELRNAGILTNDEFEELKKRLLG